MYFVPLSQLESVELLIHSLKAAAGEADCSTCPARKVCMQQCLTIADSVEQMLQSGTLPQMGDAVTEAPVSATEEDPKPPSPDSKGKGRLKIVK
ncbi:radical SAM additional 4Fe4S-binding SPASM domain-containing protein [Desulfuromusa kysingii]|uniref:Radical SAM additional 4Fe4S-binding SPASM domain-containing protein n=1 Tax=Desulfuromusa kysingii TaxID=37625 RepID=A0A1H4EEL8_9BACT|nr:hypothetical protein [Desulfuromusa kysingii]SEA82722.1 radical SAM additional 4Fe4S-binding SPASM domain-containing protein [Desulfuromusa kysingii]